MLILKCKEEPAAKRFSLLLKEDEARDLVEKISYLLKNPEYHHDHMEDREQVLDVVVIDWQALESYSDDIQLALNGYRARDE